MTIEKAIEKVKKLWISEIDAQITKADKLKELKEEIAIQDTLEGLIRLLAFKSGEDLDNTDIATFIIKALCGTDISTIFEEL
jgi:hypothetical protein